MLAAVKSSHEALRFASSELCVKPQICFAAYGSFVQAGCTAPTSLREAAIERLKELHTSDSTDDLEVDLAAAVEMLARIPEKHPDMAAMAELVEEVSKEAEAPEGRLGKRRREQYEADAAAGFRD